MERSLFYIFVVLGAATLLGYYQIWWLLLFLLISLIPAFVFTAYSRLAVCTLIVLLAGVMWVNLRADEIPASLPVEEGYPAWGRIIDYPQNETDRGKFKIRTGSKNHYLQKIQVFTSFPSNLQKGDMIAIKGLLKPPDPPGNPGQFDYPGYLKHEHIFYTLSVKAAEDIDILQPAGGINRVMNTFRERGMAVVNSRLPPQEAGVLLGMLLGKTDGIEEEQYKDFQKTGVIHIFAVSGLHVGFLVLLCGWISSLLNLTRRNTFLFNVSIILLYGTLIGWPVSVARASIMAASGLAAYYLGREKDLLNSLGLAGIVILLYDPQALFKISFQLSFLAAFGLVYIFPVLRESVKNHLAFWDLLLIPVSAQLAVIPLIAWHFNLFSPISFISNVIITYTAGISVILGFVTLALAPLLPGLAGMAAYPAGFLVEIIIHANDFFKSIPLGHLWVATPLVISAVLYYMGLLLAIYALKKRISNRYLYIGLLIMSSFIMVLCLPASIYNRGTLEIVFIDVGQGDSILIKTPGGKFILVDGGGSDFYDVASTRLMPYLHHRGIRKLFLAINTHPDTDHLAGIEKTVEELAVEHIGLPQTISSVQEYSRLQDWAARKKIKTISMYQGQTVNLEEDFTLRVLHPARGEAQGADYNEESLVLLMESRGISLLLTGDVGLGQLQELGNSGLLGPISIIKVPHHGSRFSLDEEFYQRLRPQWAVICVGNNSFGHPHPEVLKCLETNKIKVLRTDQNGNIYFNSRGRVKTFK